ncbi:GIY-YIG nuclease family protein [Paenibacillus sp. IITD108]|uniref:GIY-YIG nuclease family protein n=1 Tax=Paenibacillus sp. IITD108 TaxID=3116649 RepID=UPI002F426645
MPFHFQADQYPTSAGCYLMRNKEGELLYIGKAKNIRNRLRSYFTRQHTERKLIQLVEQVASIDVMLVNNEAESLLLENNLIKQHKPPFNRALIREETGYAYLQLTEEEFPRLAVYYRNRDDSSSRPAAAKKFGPFKSSRYRDELASYITEQFGLRSCEAMPKKVCLLYHIHRCSGICEGLIGKEQYQQQAEEAALLLSRPADEIIASLYEQIQKCSDALHFEKAQKLLLTAQSLEAAAKEKQIVERQTDTRQAVLYFGENEVCILAIQHGLITGIHIEQLQKEPNDGTELSDAFIAHYDAEHCPDEIIVNRIGNRQLLLDKMKLLRKREAIKRQPALTIPKRGVKFELLQLAERNYFHYIEQHSSKLTVLGDSYNSNSAYES